MHQQIVTGPSRPSPLITVTKKFLSLNAFATLGELADEKTLTTVLPIPITFSIYEPKIVPAAKPNAYPEINTGSSTSLIT